MNREERRLFEARDRRAHWKRWGPYVSDRAWGTVREDYSPDGQAWRYTTHDHARSLAYRWNEDGLAGWSDRHQRICLALALWNGRDPILKERLFGLTGEEGNHGEDVKECYYYLDGTPTHSYQKFLYKYPQQAFPYERLIYESRRRGRHDPEFELVDTGIFDGDEYFDVVVEYAKTGVEDLCMRITATNRGPHPAPLHILPVVWFRNTWSWREGATRPRLAAEPAGESGTVVCVHEPTYGPRRLHCGGSPTLLFTENETNVERLYGVPPTGGYFKDGINDAVVCGRTERVNPRLEGTRVAAWYRMEVQPAESVEVRVRLTDQLGDPPPDFMTTRFAKAFKQRQDEANEFYASVFQGTPSADARSVARQAIAGLSWSKQFYHYVVKDWLDGDPSPPPPPAARLRGRNRDWRHLYNADVISVPDKWEYPWYACWDLAFQCVAMAPVDPDFSKEQLVLFLREWYQHPNGQLPAYEWALSDVNPPVHAWAVYRVYKIEQRRRGTGDRLFLERAFHKLLLNFTWWLNRKDVDGNNLFDGGFLGLDNVGPFDRSAPLPPGWRLDQSDGTSWMAMYALNMLAIAVELARFDAAYEDVASKFWEHFLYIARAMNHRGHDGVGLWDEEAGFFCDLLLAGDEAHRVQVRSMVGLIPLFAVETLEPEVLERLKGFKRRLDWFTANRSDLTAQVAAMDAPGRGERRLLALLSPDRLRRVLQVMLDESEFLSPYGVRSLSRRHAHQPYRLNLHGQEHVVAYEPADSRSGLFGGNSNWRGPIWLPVNFLIVESLQRFHHYFGDEFRIECPTGSGRWMNLAEVAGELSRRIVRLFMKDEAGHRPVNGPNARLSHDPYWHDLVTFHEFFDGETGAGLGASHQTGWTALVAKLIQQCGPTL